MILLIDNYDSFVHNLARHFRRLGQETLVVRNDAIDVAGVRKHAPDAIVISPGPCTPQESGWRWCGRFVAKFRYWGSVLDTRPSRQHWAAEWYRPPRPCMVERAGFVMTDAASFVASRIQCAFAVTIRSLWTKGVFPETWK
jgi:hypothetical protein